jgi:hypothetical protein
VNHAPSFHARYTKAMFEIPRPQFIQPAGKQSETLWKALAVAEPDLELQNMAVTPLPALNRRPGGAIGFFEQGLHTGVVALMIPVLTSAVVLGYYGIRAAQRRIIG